MKLFIAALVASVSVTANAGDIFGNNANNGNVYSNSGNGYNAYNTNTGSRWSAQSNGSRTSGIDSRGNSWSYDRNSGSYINYGTGEIRQNGRRW